MHLRLVSFCAGLEVDIISTSHSMLAYIEDGETIHCDKLEIGNHTFMVQEGVRKQGTGDFPKETAAQYFQDRCCHPTHLALAVKGHRSIETLGGPYYKKVPFPRIPEYRGLIRDPTLIKPAVQFAGVEPPIISNYPNIYPQIFGLR